MANQDSDEKIVPWGIVLITIGLIVAATAAAILFVQPATAQKAVANLPLPFVTVVVTPIPQATDEPASSANTEISLPANFVSLADAPRGTIADRPQRIVIPSIDLDAPVADVGLSAIDSGGQTYYQWQVPASYEAGWHNTSAPLGQAGNTVLNGHHNVFGEVFGNLIELDVGAKIVVYDKSTPYRFTVSEVQILAERDQPLEVRLENAKWIQPTSDERLTLVTCWPYTDNSHRVVVVAYPDDSN